MEIMLFNTMDRKKELFIPLVPGHVGMYTCGPTVYSQAHIGNFRAYIFEDTLKRVLQSNGLEVKHVLNITDVGHLTSDADTGEDKMELGARREKRSVWQIAEQYTNQFFADLEKLNVLQPSIVCRASDHVNEMIDLVKRLEERGYTYIIDDGVYFDTSKFPRYGSLTGTSFEKLNESLKAGARIEFNPSKKNVTDFALWRFTRPGEKRQMEWDSPWGRGFPGWHIECSAMSMKYLGETFDIHAGGEDHIAVHHSSEIAQSEAATGKRLANYWLHNAFLVFSPTIRMSKSKGNIVTVDELIEDGLDPLSYRYLCLTAHYRSELLFSWENLKAAQESLSTLRENLRISKEEIGERATSEAQDFKAAFILAMNDDLDTPKALSIAWLAARSKSLTPRDKADLLTSFDTLLGLDLAKAPEDIKISEETEELIRERENARMRGDYKTADELRNRIRQQGIILEDTPKGVRRRREP